METIINEEIERYFAQEIMRLNLRTVAINRMCRKFELSKNDANTIYKRIRLNLKRTLRFRAWAYLLLGSIFFGVGLFATISKTSFIFYGAIVGGFAMLFTSAGYFRISLLKS